MLIGCCNEQTKEQAKKRNAELQAERDVIVANNQALVKRANEMFGSRLAAAEKRRNELEAELQHANMECIELEEKTR